MPHEQAASQGHLQQRAFLAECALIHGFNGNISIPTVWPLCTKNILSSYFECRDERVFLQQISVFIFQMQRKGACDHSLSMKHFIA